MKRVLWKEGLFMRPQHLQKQDYYWMERICELYQQQGPYAYGITHFKYLPAALSRGELRVQRLEGIMPDGTVFNLTGCEAQLACVIPDKIDQAWLVLTLPPHTVKGVRVAESMHAAKTERYFISQEKVSDELVGEQELLELEILEPNFKLRVVSDLAEVVSDEVLPLLKLLERRDNGALIVDEDFVPPLLNIRAHPGLSQSVEEISGLLNARRQKLLERLGGGDQYGVAGLNELLLLQLINRYEPILQHYERQIVLHPEWVYREFLKLAGELRTFTSEDRGYSTAPMYQHQDLAKCFSVLMMDLREALNYVFDDPAILIPLVAHQYHLYLAEFGKMYFDYQRLVLEVKADMPLDQVRHLFPSHVKLGPTEMIRDLVNLQIPGIGVSALPVAPRQIPYHSGTVYFELDNQGELWEKLRHSPGMALHLGGDFPGVELRLWAIKR
jgi:type VI secretion system protein ImpJ